tara:strand:+ start:1019 stop:1204 length:186 start_codon:yes stop_codon:yes gene_type:complete
MRDSYQTFFEYFKIDLSEKYLSDEKIEKSFYKMKLKLSVEEKVFERFKLDASEELKKICSL